MYTKNLKEELTLEELRLLKKAISYTVYNNTDLDENTIKRLKILYDKVIYE